MDKKKLVALAIFVFFGLFAFSFANPIEQDQEETILSTLDNMPAINIDGNTFKIEVNSKIPSFKTDVLDGVNVSINHNIDNKKVGKYEVIFKATDKDGLTNEVKHDFYVVDTTKPIIKLIGGNVLSRINQTYKDAGAIATDNYDGNITDKIVTKNNVNTSKKGKYTVTYNVADKNNNKATEVIRYVTIVDDTELLNKIKEAKNYLDNKDNKLINDLNNEIDKANDIINDDKSSQETIDKEISTLDDLIEKIKNQEFTVKFIDYNNKLIKEEKVKYGEVPTSPENPARKGYTFKSWDKEIAPVKENITIKAQYEVITYKIEYDITNVVNPTTYTVETSTIKLACVEKVGYKFLYWEDETGKKITEIKKGTVGDKKLKAVFKENENTKYTIIYYYEKLDGSYKEEKEEKTGKTNQEIKLNIKKNGYKVNEQKSTLGGNILPDGSLALEVTLDLNTYKTEFYVNNKIYKTLEFKYQEKVTKPKYDVAEGYIFSDWETDEVMPAKNQKYYATYEKIEYTVIFKYYQNNTLVETKKTVKHGESVEAPKADELVYIGGSNPYYLEFKNWNSSLKNIKENKTIEAVYEKLGIASTRLYRLKLLKRPSNGEGRNPIWYEKLGKKKNIEFVLSAKKINEVISKAKKNKKHEAVLSLNQNEIYNYMTENSKVELKSIEEAAIKKFEKLNVFKKDCKFEWYVLKYNTNDGWHLDGEVTGCKSIFD